MRLRSEHPIIAGEIWFGDASRSIEVRRQARPFDHQHPSEGKKDPPADCKDKCEKQD
jgi:hypothetical protein